MAPVSPPVYPHPGAEAPQGALGSLPAPSALLAGEGATQTPCGDGCPSAQPRCQAHPCHKAKPSTQAASRAGTGTEAHRGHHLLHPRPHEPGTAGVTLCVDRLPFPPPPFYSPLAAQLAVSWVRHLRGRFPPAGG